MDVIARVLLIASLLFAVAVLAHEPGPTPLCHREALSRLRKADAQAYRDIVGLEDRLAFDAYLECGARDLGLSGAFHEGVHGLTGTHYVFADGRRLPVVRSVRFQPREILPMIPDVGRMSLKTYRETYFQSAASSKDRYFVLLDEFNAYARQLRTTTALVRSQSARDGVAAMMLFVKLTVERARRAHPADWKRMREPEHVALLRRLWMQAEIALADACAVRGLGLEDATIMESLYSYDRSEALSLLLGFRPVHQADCHPSRHVDELIPGNEVVVGSAELVRPLEITEPDTP